MLEGEFRKEDFPGSEYGPPTNMSCQDLGLDVRTWISEGLVDYVCPSLFSPLGIPRTREFADLAKGTKVGVYPTLSYAPRWTHVAAPADLADNEQTRRAHLREVCLEALQCYEEGADGISLFNWFPHLYPLPGGTYQGWGRRRPWGTSYDDPMGCAGIGQVEQVVMPLLGDPQALRKWAEP
jgi:hypothetical protein